MVAYLVHHPIWTRRSHLGILCHFTVWPLLWIRLLYLLRIVEMYILIIFILMKSVNAVLWRNTLMLRILINSRSTVLLSRVELLILNLLRVLNVSIIHILAICSSLASLWAMVEWLTRCIGMHEISLVGLVHDWTWWFSASYTLGFLILKDIRILLRITLRATRTCTSRLKLNGLFLWFGLIW